MWPDIDPTWAALAGAVARPRNIGWNEDCMAVHAIL